MGLLGITSLRPGPSGNPKAPNAANVDEAKAMPGTTLPDPLVIGNGGKVTSAREWVLRRAEIAEDFDREIYGRTPAGTPRVRWKVTGRADEVVANVPVVTRTLVGHVDNAAYRQIPLLTSTSSVTTPAKSMGPVPVMLNFGFGPRPVGAPPRPPAPGPSWQELLVEKGWGYAVFVPTSVQPDNGAGLTRGIDSAWSTKDSHASSTTGTGRRPRRGPGAPAARSTTLKPTKPLMQSTSGSRVYRDTGKLPSSRWPTTRGSSSGSSGHR